MNKSDQTPPPSSKPSSVLPRKTPDLTEHYTLGEKIGRGSSGTTCLCTDKSNGKQYACKSILKSTLNSKEDYEDVLNEIEIMHHLSELSNVVRIRETYEDSESVHLVMELCEGGELSRRIKENKRFNERKAACLIKTIVEVVEGCHSLGVMHGDLKLENFLFVSKAEDASLKAIDFGLSVFYKPGDVFNKINGTVYYVAPEVLEKKYGREADVWSAGVILYLLLSGYFPFYSASKDAAETFKKIFDQILKKPLNFKSEPWPSISGGAKDLVHKMLNRDPKKRFTAHQVLCHPWIVGDGVPPDKPSESAVLSRLKRFSEMNKLQKMALRVIAEKMPEEEIGGLKKLFKIFDTDSTGTITCNELTEGLRKLGSDLMEYEMQALMEEADMDNSGTIDCNEFLAATLHLNKLERENLRNAFSFFDKDGTGYITIDGLSQACKDFGIGDNHLNEMIKEIDQNKGWKIDYSEFEAVMRMGTAEK
ncbi:calcium-dependent protein kinase 24-like [Asparagus officinalis]|uniref:calcium-dependent protein kinase 24-like n=1 Tax=Asparagus officinalis TaxID=4686 RepID=UPI00098E0D6C|nr:calcium-dependent protein kinase 24-like [Asparagus officinalis]